MARSKRAAAIKTSAKLVEASGSGEDDVCKRLGNDEVGKEETHEKLRTSTFSRYSGIAADL
jgi:hypothetical protein